MGCRVKKSPKNKAGQVRLAFRLIFRGPTGEEVRSWEGTEEEATPANERLLKAKAVIIEDEIRKGTFDYLKHFPHGNKAGLFIQYRASAQPKTIRQYYQSWKKDKVPPFVKKKRARMYASHFDLHILPLHGDRYMAVYSVAEIRELRAELVEKKKLKMKTARNVIDATLRALFRDAKAEGVIEKTPFDDLPQKWWPKTVKPPPDPFEEAEREQICEFFRNKYMPRWPQAYAFVFALFWTGARQSELTARTWRDYDPRSGKLSIENSRVDGEEGATKTRASKRTIPLMAPVRELLNSIRPLRCRPDDYIFTDSPQAQKMRENEAKRLGKAAPARQPIDQKEFAWRHFWPALDALKLRKHDFYATRDTFISVLLSHREPAKSVAEYCGTSVYMIEESYGKWIGSSENFGAAALEAAKRAKSEKAGEKAAGAETNTELLPQVRLVRGAGFEP